MFCEKCGSQLPDDAKFCEKCGSSTEPGAVAGPGAAAAAVPAAPSAFALAMKKFFSKKRNVAIAAAALLLVIAVIVVVIIIASQPEKIYIDDYFDVEFSGVDGYGNAYLTSTSEQNEKLEKLNKKLFPDGEHNIQYLIKISLDISDDEEGSLKNGDKIKVKLDVGDLYDYLDGYKIVLRNKTVKVKGLYKQTEVNVLDYIEPVITGYNGHGENESEYGEYVMLPNGLKVKFRSSYDRIYIVFYSSESDNYVTEMAAVIDKYENLANGDTITATFDISENSSEYLFKNYGVKLSSQTKTYTVSGLEEPEKFDVASYIKGEFVGYSGAGYMNVVIPSESVTVGSYNYSFTNTSYTYQRRFYVDIKDGSGAIVWTVEYYADKFENVTNGEIIAFETHTNVDNILEQYGIEVPEKFEVTVEGMQEPFKPDPIGRGTYSFSGYDGYGKFIFSLPEDKCVYTSEDGKYTVKLTLTENDYSYTVNVVVADESGKNFITFDYTADKGGTLSNGNTIGFYSNISSLDLHQYLDEYGIYFEDNIYLTIEGLTAITKVDLLDNLTYSFAKDGDHVKMTLGLNATEVKAGNNTISLSLENHTSFGSEYTRLHFTVKDESGNDCGSGYYYVQSDDLREGQTVYIYFSCGEQHSIATLTGVVFETDNNSVIVSSK